MEASSTETTEIPEALLTLREVAAILRVHPRTVERYVERRILPTVNLSTGTRRMTRRVRPADLTAFMNRFMNVSPKAFQQLKAEQ